LQNIVSFIGLFCKRNLCIFKEPTNRSHSVGLNPKPFDLNTGKYFAVCCSALQCIVVCCSVLQCIAVCCSVLQCVVLCCSVLQCVVVCCRVLQCVAVCCNVLQCVFRWSKEIQCGRRLVTIVLQCVAGCFSMFQCILTSLSNCYTTVVNLAVFGNALQHTSMHCSL